MSFNPPANSIISKKNNKRKEKLTTVSNTRNITTGISPTTVRLSPNDKAALNVWLSDLSDEAGKNITLAKLIRGMTHMKDNVNSKKLLDAIKDIS
jgi:hypothetical protein